MRVAYIALIDPGNINAHAIQVMKNVQAWAGASEDFELVANLKWAEVKRLDPAALAEQYGLQRSFALAAYPLRGDYGRLRLSFLENWFFRLAAKRCRARGVDLVYTRTFGAPRHTMAQGLPTLVETHSTPEYNPASAGLFAQIAHPLCLGVVTITPQLAERYQALGVPAEKIVVAPDGVDLAVFARPQDKTEARRRLGLDPARPLAVYAGHLYDGRGVEHILAAAAALPAVDFLLVGGHPPDVARWRERASAAGLANFILTGFVVNGLVPAHLWAGDVLLMPYGTSCPTAEWMSPLKMFEYMAAGRPLVASDLAALRNVLTHGVNAWLAPPDGPEGLIEAVRTLLARPELAQGLAVQARADVAQYSWDNRVARLMEFAKARLGKK
jgi:glycosyltransferase involved in cell wall biosynthesis